MKIPTLLVLLPATALSLGFLTSARPALATDYVWSGANGSAATDWLSAKNWKVSGAPISADKISLAVDGTAEKNLATGLGDRVSGVPGAGDTATITAGAAVTINKSVTLAALTVENGSTLQGEGDITVTSTLNLRDAQLSGAGKILISPRGTAVFTTRISGDAGGNVLNKSIDNRGNLTWASGKLALQKDFYNRGNFTVSSAAAMQPAGQAKPVFHNYGTLIKSGDNQSEIGLPFKNSGDITVRGGTLNVGTDYVQTDGTLTLDGGNLSSAGTLQVDGGSVGGSGELDCDVVNNGTFEPGYSPGYIYISGNYTQTHNGTLGMDVGGTAPGTGYDQMEIGGSAYLAGTLDIRKYNNYTPYAGQNFEFLQCYDIRNNFTTFIGLYPGNFLYYKINLTPDSYVALVNSDNTAPTVSISTPVANGNYIGVSSVVGVANDVTYASGVKVVTIQVHRYATSSNPSGFLLPGNTWSATYSPANQLPVVGTKNWSAALPTLSPGQYNVKATVTDNVGRRATSTTIVFNISTSGSGGYVMTPVSPKSHFRLASGASSRQTQRSRTF